MSIDQLDFGSPVGTTERATRKKTHYYEVEGAVFRERDRLPMELFGQKDGVWKPYTGDPFRVYRLSNEMTLEEVRPYMDVEPKEDEPAGEREDA
jgi:hypothetical protein